MICWASIEPTKEDHLASAITGMCHADAAMAKQVAREFFSEPRAFEVDVRRDKEVSYQIAKWCADRIKELSAA